MCTLFIIWTFEYTTVDMQACMFLCLLACTYVLTKIMPVFRAEALKPKQNRVC